MIRVHSLPSGLLVEAPMWPHVCTAWGAEPQLVCSNETKPETMVLVYTSNAICEDLTLHVCHEHNVCLFCDNDSEKWRCWSRKSKIQVNKLKLPCCRWYVAAFTVEEKSVRLKHRIVVELNGFQTPSCDVARNHLRCRSACNRSSTDHAVCFKHDLFRVSFK